MGITKVKLRVFLAGCIVAMVTFYVEKMTITRSPMLRCAFDTIIFVSIDKEWLSLTVKVKVMETGASHLKLLH